MYIILDNQLNRIGTLSNRNMNGTPFYNDIITQQIADDDQTMTLQSVPDTTNATDRNGNTKSWGHTLDSIYIPYGYTDTKNIQEGNSLAYQDPNNGRWYVMRLTSVTDATDNSGNHYKEASGVNLCIWKLGKTVHYAETIKNANSKKAFSALFDDTGWYIDPDSELVGSSTDIQFDGTSSSQALLQQLCQTYGAELDAYVLFPQSYKMSDGKYYSSDFRVALKYVEIKRKLGQDKGDRIVYGRNATNIQRTLVDDSLYTRLYVYGPGGATCACEMTDNEPYVEDETANQVYNPALGDNAENYLEGAITSQTMKNSERLAQWGYNQLKIFNHPRANYTVSVSNALNAGQGNKMIMDANLGDVFRVIDYKMDPQLTAESRVIRKQLSFANPYSNNITLGEYTTVNVIPPKFIDDMQKGEYTRINQILDEIKRNPSALTCTIDRPDGCSWHYGEKHKRFIAHISVLGEDITKYIQPKGYIWQLWQKGQINNQFTDDHGTNGQTLVLQNDIELKPSGVDSGSDTSSGNNADIMSSGYNWNNNDFSNNTSSSDDNSGAAYYNNDGVNYFNDNDQVHFWDENSNNSQSLGYRMLDDDNASSADNSNNDPSNASSSADSEDDSEVNSDQINELLSGPNNVTGNVRLLIDTDYISDQESTNFNTRRLQHLFTFNNWTNAWGDKLVDAIEDINYNPKENNYYASTVYHGSQRPDKSNDHTEITRLDTNGNYQDSMIMLFSQKNNNFGLDYTTPGGPYIWTTFKGQNNKYELVRLPYQAHTVIKLDDLPANDKVMQYNTPHCTAYYDNSSDMVLISYDDAISSPNHQVDFYNAKDLLNNHEKAKPFKTLNLVDYGFAPKRQAYGNQNISSQQTFQSSCLHYPYYYFDTGDINMSDQRMIYCIDIKSGTKIFSKAVDMNNFDLNEPNKIIGQDPGSVVFSEPEALSWMADEKGNLWFLYSLNVGYDHRRNSNSSFNDEDIPQPNYIHYQQLYAVGLDMNKQPKDNGPQEK